MSQKWNYEMSPIAKKKFEILDSIYRSKDGCSVNELTEMLNELTRLSSVFNWTVSADEIIVPKYIGKTTKSKDVIVHAITHGVNVVHCGYYDNCVWRNMSGAEINVVKWGEFPSI